MVEVWIGSTETIGGNAVFTKIYLTPPSAGSRRSVEFLCTFTGFELLTVNMLLAKLCLLKMAQDFSAEKSFTKFSSVDCLKLKSIMQQIEFKSIS